MMPYQIKPDPQGSFVDQVAAGPDPVRSPADAAADNRRMFLMFASGEPPVARSLGVTTTIIRSPPEPVAINAIDPCMDAAERSLNALSQVLGEPQIPPVDWVDP